MERSFLEWRKRRRDQLKLFALSTNGIGFVGACNAGTGGWGLLGSGSQYGVYG